MNMVWTIEVAVRVFWAIIISASLYGFYLLGNVFLNTDIPRGLRTLALAGVLLLLALFVYMLGVIVKDHNSNKPPPPDPEE